MISALLELTYDCNWNCDFCYNDLSLKGKPLSTPQWLDLLEDLSKRGVFNLILSGGEPLMHPDFFEIGGAAKRLGFVTRIKTNGHMLTRKLAERLQEEVDPFVIEVSLHGARAETHDRLTRRQGSFARLLENLGAVQGLGLRIRVNTVLTRWNENEVPAMYAICDGLGLPLTVSDDVSPKDDGDLSPMRLSASAEGLARYRALKAEREKSSPVVEEPGKQGVAVEVPQTQQNVAQQNGDPQNQKGTKVTKACGAGSSSIAVDPLGNVFPCVQWRLPVGNLHESSLSGIWDYSEALQGVRSQTQEVKKWLAGFGEHGGALKFCAGAAYLHSGKATQIYPAAQHRLDAARGEKGAKPNVSSEKLHLRVM